MQNDSSKIIKICVSPSTTTQWLRRPCGSNINISMEFLKILRGLNDGLFDSCHCRIVMQTVNNSRLFAFNAGLVDRQKLSFVSDVNYSPASTLLGQGLPYVHTLTRLA